jgi:transposase-like protein
MTRHYQERCPRCRGKGTIVKDGPHRDEYDSHHPCPRCTSDRTALRGTGWVAVAHEERRS